MAFNNEIRLIGNLVKNPEEIATERGKFYIARIAVNSKRGEETETVFIDIKIFGNLCKDIEDDPFTKSDRILVIGRLSVDEFTDKSNVKRREPVVYANSIAKIKKRVSTEINF
jgi:single-stranded DNA-binding protein